MSDVIEKRRRLIVAGYVREVKKVHETDNIPVDVIDIIYLFFRLCDKWSIRYLYGKFKTLIMIMMRRMMKVHLLE